MRSRLPYKQEVSNLNRPAKGPRSTTERSNHEEEGANREDRRRGRRAQERGTEALRGLRGGSDRSTQGWRGGPDHGLREVLRQGAQGQGRKESPDGGEIEDRGF